MLAAACAGTGTDDARSQAYAACKKAVFTSDMGLEDAVRGRLHWPRLDSPSVTFQGGDKHYIVLIHHVRWTLHAEKHDSFVDCSARQTSAGRWVALVEVDS